MSTQKVRGSKLQIRVANPGFIHPYVDSVYIPPTTRCCRQCKYVLDESWFIEDPDICHLCIQDNKVKEEDGI